MVTEEPNVVPVGAEVSEEIQSAVAEATGELIEKMSSNEQALTKALTRLNEEQEVSGQQGEPKGYFDDPFSLLDSVGMGYRANPSQVTYETLRQMVERDTILCAIVLTRIRQVSAFCRPQDNKYGVGFTVRPRGAQQRYGRISDNLRDRCLKVERLITNMGVDHNIERDGLTAFMAKVVRDRLTYDQVCFEKVATRGGGIHSVYAHDASTFRIAQPRSTRGTPIATKLLGRTSQYLQVINGERVAQFTPKQLGFCVANPRTSLNVQGYGFPEPMMLMNTVTAHIWAEEWNRKAFCVAPGTMVLTDEGNIPIEVLSGQEFTAWTGTQWAKARAFYTGAKPVVKTKLWNGLEVETSPDHRFLAIPADSTTGEPEFLKQSRLRKGDTLLVDDSSVVDPPLDEEALLVGAHYTSSRSWGRDWTPTTDLVNDEHFWEFLGFAIGDGYWPELSGVSRGGHRRPQWMRVCFHGDRDHEAFTRYTHMLDKHGINAHEVDVPYNSKVLEVSHREFFSWLYELGFTPSVGGKTAPKLFMTLPRNLRCAVLRGWFSADGHTHKHEKGYATPTLFCTEPDLRQEALRLLWSVGVASNETGKGWRRFGELRVQDVGTFTEHVGYVQSYKNDNLERKHACWDRLHKATATVVTDLCRNHPNWLTMSKVDRGLLSKVSRGACGLSRSKARSALAFFGIPEPLALTWHHVVVDELDLEAHGEIGMYDVEVFAEEHRFVANSIIVHNSQGSTLKGVLNLKGNIPRQQFESFKRQWSAQVAGVSNAWRTPILNSEGLEFTPVQMSNTEMGYQMWIEYLVKISSAIYQIDPTEINFDLRGGTGQQPVFMSSNEAQQEISQDRGLKPLLRFFEDVFNRHVIWCVDDELEFAFVGLDAKTEEQSIELRQKQVMTTHTLNEARALEDLPPIKDGDIPLNSTYTGYLQQKAMMEQQQAPGGEGGGGQGGEEPAQPYEGNLDNAEQGSEEKQAQDKLANLVAKPGMSADEHLQSLHQNDWAESIHAALTDNDLSKSLDVEDNFYDVLDL